MNNITQNDRLLSTKDTARKCGISRTTIYERCRAGSFPPPIKLSSRSNLWLESELNTWIAKQAATRTEGASHGE